ETARKSADTFRIREAKTPVRLDGFGRDRDKGFAAAMRAMCAEPSGRTSNPDGKSAAIHPGGEKIAVSPCA
ncbi:hypothetical protein, partial [Henriciella pelagia]|uniref:hypothetical protein n=1 Tax=Henriciella pelagia TaxID=1977912 RepID=UPI0035191A15